MVTLPNIEDVKDWEDLDDDEPESVATVAPTATEKEHPGPRIYTMAQLRSLTGDHTSFIAKPIFPRLGTIMLAAPPKEMKSLVALHMAFDLCEGTKVLGHFPVHKKQPIRVLYFDQEGGIYSTKERMLAIASVRGGFTVDENFMTVELDRKMKFDHPDGLNRIRDCIHTAQPQFVIFDPVIYFHNQDENDNVRMHNKVMTPVQELNAEFGISSLLVHHFGKEGEYRQGSGPSRARGASTLWADVHTFISIKSRSNGNIITSLQLEYSLRYRKKPIPTVLEVVQVGEEMCYLKPVVAGEG